MFKLIHSDKNSKARLGKLITSNGEIDTPCFMPVGTQGTVKALSPKELEESGAKIVLSSIVQLLAPLTKVSINFLYPLIGLILSISLFYGFGKIINPVRKFGEDIKHSAKSGNF